MAVFSWPSVLVPSRCDAELRGSVKTGGRSITGFEQRAFSDAGYWTVSMDIPIHTPAKVRAYRGMMARLRQGDQIDARVFERAAPRGAGNQGTNGDASAPASYPLRATAISIRVTGADVEAGMYFCHGSYLYMVTEVLGAGPSPAFPTPTNDGEIWDDALPWTDSNPTARTVSIRIMPPLRFPIAAGDGLRLANLTLRSELQDINSGDLSLDLGRFGTATLTLRESI